MDISNLFKRTTPPIPARSVQPKINPPPFKVTRSGVVVSTVPMELFKNSRKAFSGASIPVFKGSKHDKTFKRNV